MNILNEYEEMLIGNQKKIPKSYFIFDKKGNERVALNVIKYAIENLLGWSPQEAAKFFNNNYVKIMRLEQMINYIDFPSDVTKDDIEYVLHLLYPKVVDYKITKYTLRIYENVLDNNGRYPKDYMYGYLGAIRAKICLQYSLNRNKLFKSTEELYEFFSSKTCIKYLKQNKLYQLYASFYDSPLEYMHESMPLTVKNEFLFNNYMFLNKYKNIELLKKAKD